MHVGMGAPNVLRGKSSSGNLSASDAIVAGVVDWLCADYYPAALLPAAFRIADQQLMGLPDAIALITTNPARAVGLGDSIGEIAVGLHADLCVVRRDAGTPIVTQVFVDGCSVYAIAPAYQTL
jgi:alpha-D-ribose 1-methylphosphonate 5-triphosphate diphosphatase